MNDKRYYYAEIDKDNICFNVLDCSVEMTGDSLIVLDNYDTSLLGKKYNNGAWEDVANTSEPTDSEIFQANTLLNQAGIIAKQKDMDETLAQILLNQIGG